MFQLHFAEQVHRPPDDRLTLPNLALYRTPLLAAADAER